MVSLVIGHAAPQPAPLQSLSQSDNSHNFPTEWIVLRNTVVVPFSLVVEGKAAARGVDESELLRVARLALVIGCCVCCLTARFFGLKIGLILKFFIESRFAGLAGLLVIDGTSVAAVAVELRMLDVVSIWKGQHRHTAPSQSHNLLGSRRVGHHLRNASDWFILNQQSNLRQSLSDIVVHLVYVIFYKGLMRSEC